MLARGTNKGGPQAARATLHPRKGHPARRGLEQAEGRTTYLGQPWGAASLDLSQRA